MIKKDQDSEREEAHAGEIEREGRVRMIKRKVWFTWRAITTGKQPLPVFMGDSICGDKIAHHV